MFRKALALLCKLLGASRGTDHNSEAQVVLSCDESTLHSKTPDALKLLRFSSATDDLSIVMGFVTYDGDLRVRHNV